MDREPMESTLIVSHGYDAETKLLEVELAQGKVFQVPNVEASEYAEFQKPTDARITSGGYYNRYLRPRAVLVAA